MECYGGLEIPDECSLAPCVSCGYPIVCNFEIQQCHVCQRGLTPIYELASKIACSETHRTALGLQ